MKTYYSLDSLIEDLNKLFDVSINISKNVEFEANRLNHSEFNMLRDKLKKNKIKLIVLSEEKLF